MKKQNVFKLMGVLTVLLEILFLSEAATAAKMSTKSSRQQLIMLDNTFGKEIPPTGLNAAVVGSEPYFQLLLEDMKDFQHQKKVQLSSTKKQLQKAIKAIPLPQSSAVNQISFLSTTASIIDCQNAAEAPGGQLAGYWHGDGSTTDNLPTHIIGHNPGIFNQVLQLAPGNKITVWDKNGQQRTYTVYNILDVSDDAYDRQGNEQWDSVVNQPGESISLQACIDDYWNRMVLAH